MIIGLFFKPDVFCISDRYSKHDGNGNENVTKQNGSMSRTMAARALWILYISLPSPANQVFDSANHYGKFFVSYLELSAFVAYSAGAEFQYRQTHWIDLNSKVLLWERGEVEVEG